MNYDLDHTGRTPEESIQERAALAAELLSIGRSLSRLRLSERVDPDSDAWRPLCLAEANAYTAAGNVCAAAGVFAPGYYGAE